MIPPRGGGEDLTGCSCRLDFQTKQVVSEMADKDKEKVFFFL